MRPGALPRRAAMYIGPALGAVCAAAMAARVLDLERGNGADHAFVLILLMGLMALALALVWMEYGRLEVLCRLALPVAAAFLLRALCLDNASPDYQVFLSQWAGVFREYGGFRAIALNIGDYNAPYLYFMAAVSYFDFPDLYAYKLFSILFDVLLAWGSLRLTRALRSGYDRALPAAPEPERVRDGTSPATRQPERGCDWAPLASFALALLLPTVVLNGSFWGQCDVLYGALGVHAVAQALEDRPKTSVALMAVAFSFKLQSIFILPLWGVLWLSRKIRFRDLLVFPGVYFLTMLPALLLGKPLGDVLGVYFNQMGEYPRLTLNAPSVFQFIPYGMEVDEALLARLGILAAFLLAGALLLAGFLLRGRLGREEYFLMAVLLAIGVPFFLPHMHERYFFLADVLTACWACGERRRGVPVCILAAGSSLLSYLVYLRLQYNVTVSVWGLRFVMPVEALMMLAALALTLAALLRRIKRCREKKSDGGLEHEAGILERERSAGLSEEGLSGVDEGAGSRCDLPAGDQDGAGPGGAGPAGIS